MRTVVNAWITRRGDAGARRTRDHTLVDTTAVVARIDNDHAHV
jgi:hypothetical protein